MYVIFLLEAIWFRRNFHLTFILPIKKYLISLLFQKKYFRFQKALTYFVVPRPL